MALPCELIDQVLCRVPVKYLLRFRCVSKEWCSLINSGAFIKKHAQTVIKSNASSGIVVTGDESIFLTDTVSLYADEDVAVTEIKDPLKTVFPGADFVGAANSLLCFCKNNWNDFLLYNPSTRKYRKVPSMGEFVLWFDAVKVSHCGFGYDHVNDDYKVVRIGQFAGGNQFYLVVIVYSMRTDSWTRIQDVPGNICIKPEGGRFASGVLYWLAMKYQLDFRGSIVGFDLGLGRFTEVPYPAVREKDFFLVYVGESLCVLDNYSDSRVDVCLMNSHGMENPWYRAFSVEQPGALGTFKFVKPVAFSESGKYVLLEVDHAKLIWYDLEKKAAKNVRIRGILNKFDSYVYTEGLLQLTEGKQLPKPSHDKKEKKQQMERLKLFTQLCV